MTLHMTSKFSFGQTDPTTDVINMFMIIYIYRSRERRENSLLISYNTEM